MIEEEDGGCWMKGEGREEGKKVEFESDGWMNVDDDGVIIVKRMSDCILLRRVKRGSNGSW